MVAAPRWDDVDAVITRLCATRGTFATETSGENLIAQYEPGVRLMHESDRGPRWVAINDVRECWATFERLGSVNRQDLLEPGFCSAFMFALFAQVDGVVRDPADPARLALSSR
ncbi:MAG TPA: hypothetical protein VKA45_02200 [Gaiellaceae bacterium]|nr:hypothetical protein [Gaiellaceae bacterium]